MDTNILLSICIPTYNGGEYLRTTIDCLLKAIGSRDNIEIVVSDNCSTAETREIIEGYVSQGIIRANFNDENLGFNGNLMILLEKFAKGDYCWIIGDDDFVDSDTISLLYPFLVKKEYDYFSINSKSFTQEQYLKYQAPQGRSLDYKKCDYFDCVDSSASGWNVLGTFMSSHIFKLDKIKEIGIKEEYRSNAWDNYLNVFPNSNLMLDAFHSSNNCICVNTPLITALLREKTYSNKWDFLVKTILPDLYTHYVEVAGTPSKLTNSERMMNHVIAWTNFRHFLNWDFGLVNYKTLLSYKTVKTLFYKISQKISS